MHIESKHLKHLPQLAWEIENEEELQRLKLPAAITLLNSSGAQRALWLCIIQVSSTPKACRFWSRVIHAGGV
jgi:hypothetical protein